MFDTGLVLTPNVAVPAFAVTVTLAGTVATAVLLLFRVSSAPPVGAGPLRVTVAVNAFPPKTEVGMTSSEVGTGGITVSAAVWFVLL